MNVAIRLLLPFFCTCALADGILVDKVYNPYVNPLETEIEYRVVGVADDKDAWDDRIIHRLSVGHALSDRWYGEAYLVGDEDEDHSLHLTAFEAEAKLQLTEQGEFDYDWGLMFEVEKKRENKAWEAATTLISVREIGRWVNTGNLSVKYEWGEELKDEAETLATLQTRYRLSPRFEPAFEVYLGEDTRGIGPVLTGSERIGKMDKLYWEFGTIAGLGEASPDMTVRLLLEYEFY